jgi:hypothetical protein
MQVLTLGGQHFVKRWYWNCEMLQSGILISSAWLYERHAVQHGDCLLAQNLLQDNGKHRKLWSSRPLSGPTLCLLTSIWAVRHLNVGTRYLLLLYLKIFRVWLQVLITYVNDFNERRTIRFVAHPIYSREVRGTLFLKGRQQQYLIVRRSPLVLLIRMELEWWWYSSEIWENATKYNLWIPSVSQRKQHFSITNFYFLTQFTEIFGVCSENHVNRVNTNYGQNVVTDF